MLDRVYLESIKSFEGFAPQAKWDYAQHTNGFGTRARFQGEIITPAEAHRRFASEINTAAEIVDRFAPNLSEGARAALTSLTFNAGPAWTKSGLGKAVASGDFETAKELFLKYNKAGGEVLPGLAARRATEAAWFESSPPANTTAVLSQAIERPDTTASQPSYNPTPVAGIIESALVCDTSYLDGAQFLNAGTAPGTLSFFDLPFAFFDLLSTFMHDQSLGRTNTNEDNGKSAIIPA